MADFDIGVAAGGGGASGGTAIGETKTFAKGFAAPDGWVSRAEALVLNKADYPNAPATEPDGSRAITGLQNITTPSLNATQNGKPVIAGGDGKLFVILKPNQDTTSHSASLDGGATFSVSYSAGHYRCYPGTAQWFAPTGEFYCGYSYSNFGQPTGFMLNPTTGTRHDFDPAASGHSTADFSAVVGTRLYACLHQTTSLRYTDDGRNWSSVFLPTSGTQYITGLAAGADGALYVTSSDVNNLTPNTGTDYVSRVELSGARSIVHASANTSRKLLSANIDGGGNLGGLTFNSSNQFEYVTLSASDKEVLKVLSAVTSAPQQGSFFRDNYSQTCISNCHVISWMQSGSYARTIMASPFDIRSLSFSGQNGKSGVGPGVDFGEVTQIEHETNQTVRVRGSASVFSYNTETQFFLQAIEAAQGLNYMTYFGE